MAREIRTFDITIPANTPQSSNFTSAMSFPDREVVKVVVRVPPGPRGEVGFAIGSSGRAFLPEPSGSFIVTDDEIVEWDLDGQIDSGAWTFFGYNTGLFDHTIRVRFHVDLVGTHAAALGSAGAGQPIDSGALGPAPPAPLPPFPPPAPLPPLPVPPAPPPPPVPPVPPPPPPVPFPPGPPAPPTTRGDVMPAEVSFPAVLVPSVPYDVVLSYNPSFARGYVTVRNPGGAAVSGRLVYVSDTSGQPLATFDYTLQPGQGTTWHLDTQTQVGDVILQSTSGPVTVSWKVGTL